MHKHCACFVPPLVPSPCALMVVLVLVLVSGCAVGPDFEPPMPEAPDDWTSWRSGDDSLRLPAIADETLPREWWRVFNDPVLDRLQEQVFRASPDLRTAALHVAQATVQRRTVAAQRGPELAFDAGASRIRQSEYGAGIRLIDIIAPAAREPVVEALSEPFTFYQTGFDFSWEPDLWGRVSRSVEAADAVVAREAALLAMARLTLASDMARSYFELRTTQRQIRIAREDIAVLEDRVDLLEARVQSGLADELDLERQRAELAAVRAALPALLAQEGASANRMTLLLGERPGELTEELQPPADTSEAVLPDLALGLPSEIALRRPDIRAAEARLHAAVAGIGIARADLYPSIRLGASFGYESYLSSEFLDGGARVWSVGPILNLPLFDRGRRKSVVQLRELEQQEAALAYRQTVLQAWHEIDGALDAYAAEWQEGQELEMRERSARQAYELAQARYDAGVTDFTAVLDSQRGYLQARRDLAISEGRLNSRFVAVNKSIGNAPFELPAGVEAQPSSPN